VNRATMIAQATALLARWAQAVESYWYALDDVSGMGCYGPGYIHWGIQSNFNYAAALATLAAQPGMAEAGHWRARALGALRFALATHLTGDRPGLNGTQWGHSWISMLGIECAMHGIELLRPYFDDADLAALRRVLTSEATWLLHDGHRGGQKGVLAGVWNSSGRSQQGSSTGQEHTTNANAISSHTSYEQVCYIRRALEEKVTSKAWDATHLADAGIRQARCMSWVHFFCTSGR